MSEEAGLVTPWQVVFTRHAQKDARRSPQPAFGRKRSDFSPCLPMIRLGNLRPFEKIPGDLQGAYSRRINIQHRLVYQVSEKERVVKVLRMWTHYDRAVRILRIRIDMTTSVLPAASAICRRFQASPGSDRRFPAGTSLAAETGVARKRPLEWGRGRKKCLRHESPAVAARSAIT